jgi:hypothetical protein
MDGQAHVELEYETLPWERDQAVTSSKPSRARD